MAHTVEIQGADGLVIQGKLIADSFILAITNSLQSRLAYLLTTSSLPRPTAKPSILRTPPQALI